MQTNLEPIMHELRAMTLFSGFSDSQIQVLCAGAQLVTLQHRQSLLEIGMPAEYFGVVVGGAFKLLRANPDGKETIMEFVVPGGLIGVFIMPQKQPIFPVSARAIGRSRFLKIPRQTYLDSWKQHFELLHTLQEVMSHRLLRLHHEKTLMTATLEQKVASCLLSLMDDSGGPELELPFPLTRQEIADYLGSTVESVIRIMSHWSKEGLLKTNDQKIRVLRADKLIEVLGRL